FSRSAKVNRQSDVDGGNRQISWSRQPRLSRRRRNGARDGATGERILSRLLYWKLSAAGRSRARQVHHGKTRGSGQGAGRAGTASLALRGLEMIGMTKPE